MNFVRVLTSFAAETCIQTALFGEVCDDCHGGAIFKIIAVIIQVLSIGIGAAAVIGIIISGIQYITSSGDPARMTKAKSRLIEVVIGILAYGVALAFLEFLIPGGVFGNSLEASDSCPVETSKTTPGGQEGASTIPGRTGSEGEIAGGTPMATVAGKTSAGYISCPRNAGYTYKSNPAAGSTSVDKFYQSVAQSCPFTAVVYSKSAEDEACAPGGTMHAANGGKWCLVNSKIDVYEYQKYLKDNHISQDGKTCTTTGDECSSEGNLRDWGMCNYFSYTFASNLNSGEVVSNDALAWTAGTALYNARYGRTTQGNVVMNWRDKELAVYSDNLTGVTYSNSSLPRYPEASGMSAILAELRAGRAAPIGVHSTRVDSNPNTNCGHYMTVIGYVKSCGGGSCNANDLVVMNTNGAISTLGNSNYRLGYRRECTGG